MRVRDRFLRLYYVHMGESCNNCTMCFKKKSLAISLVFAVVSVQIIEISNEAICPM